jgi:hypothetical protein
MEATLPAGESPGKQEGRFLFALVYCACDTSSKRGRERVQLLRC